MVTNKTESISIPLTPSEASASETKEKQKLLELAPSELSRKLSGGRRKSICREINERISISLSAISTVEKVQQEEKPLKPFQGLFPFYNSKYAQQNP